MCHNQIFHVDWSHVESGRRTHLHGRWEIWHRSTHDLCQLASEIHTSEGGVSHRDRDVGSVICDGRIVVKRTKLHNIYILILEKFIPISDLCTKYEREQSFIVVIRIRK